ncbi:DUF7008 domain-containing protein [Streptomyces mutomycini]|uniref:DUF7008 domain-containing protein n=1 Tax=Streptomyces mutomycini TaxID=284036 RepID=A0ABW0AXA0_9ACTN
MAGLLELQPWLKQWHDQPDPLFTPAPAPAKFFEGERQMEQGKHRLTDDDLRAWRPGRGSPRSGRSARAGARRVPREARPAPVSAAVATARHKVLHPIHPTRLRSRGFMSAGPRARSHSSPRRARPCCGRLLGRLAAAGVHRRCR